MPDATTTGLRTARTTPAQLLDAARTACDLARKAGADDAVASVTRRRGLEFRWRDGELEKVQEDATRGLAIALYVDGRYSTHATNDLDPTRLEGFLRDAVALARNLEPDPYRRIPDPEFYAGRAEVDLDLVDPVVVDLAREVRLDWCRTMTERAREHDDVISSTAQVQDEHAMVGRASTNGFEGTHAETAIVYGASVTIREGDTKKPEDAWHVGGTHREGLPDPDDVGREALRRVLARRGAQKVSSRRTTMVVHPEAGAMLIGRVLPALTAGAVHQGRSFLADKRDQKLASEALHLVDDPFVRRGLGSRLFDGEGIAAKVQPILEDGTLRTYFVDTYYGRKLGWKPTTGSPSNLVFRHGPKDLEGLLADVEDGILVTSWLGGNANATTGDFSYGVRGHVVRNGQVEEPVGEMNVTGTYLDLLQRLVAVGNDPRPWFTCRTPTLVFDDVQFSGN